ncbi:MAG: hypothetical protein MK052_04910 [Alphaproteobacteria bacterium]|nr:hypothetical protein [Alphaproteobacteria bacterium]
MKFSIKLLAAVSLLTLSACGVYQDYPNDNTSVKSHHGSKHHTGYHGSRHYSGTHPYAAHNMNAHGHVDNRHGDVVVGQDHDSYMRQNDDKWMYNSCPPGAAKRGDC